MNDLGMYMLFLKISFVTLTLKKLFPFMFIAF